MPRVLFIAAHRPNRSPSQRFRFEQYIPFLEQNGYTCDFSWLVSPKDDLFFYQEGYAIKKLLFVIKTYYIRLQDILKANHYDIIFIQREAIMFRSVFFEKSSNIFSISGYSIINLPPGFKILFQFSNIS